MLSKPHLHDPDLSAAQAERLLSMMVRAREENRLRAHYSSKLWEEFGIQRDPDRGNSSTTIRKLFLSALAVAAMFAMVIGTHGLFQPDLQSMVDTQVSSIELSSARSLNNADVNAALYNSLQRQFAGEVDLETLKLAEKLASAPGASAEEKLNFALTQLKAGLAVEAITSFRAIRHDYPLYTNESYYYEGLALIQTGRLIEARQVLKNLEARDGGRFYELAQQLLKSKELKKIKKD